MTGAPCAAGLAKGKEWGEPFVHDLRINVKQKTTRVVILDTRVVAGVLLLTFVRVASLDLAVGGDCGMFA
jgi:hypothetical protein